MEHEKIAGCVKAGKTKGRARSPRVEKIGGKMPGYYGFKTRNHALIYLLISILYILIIILSFFFYV
jgi:hypothetical protein